MERLICHYNDIVALHQGRRANGGAPASANRLLILMRYIFNLALRWETPGVSKNPTKDVPLFEENNKRERYLSQEEAQRLYAVIQDSESRMLQFIVPMLLLTGARKREVLDARWSDFDMGQQVWRVSISKSGKPRYIPLSGGGGASPGRAPSGTGPLAGEAAGLPLGFSQPGHRQALRLDLLRLGHGTSACRTARGADS